MFILSHRLIACLFQLIKYCGNTTNLFVLMGIRTYMYMPLGYVVLMVIKLLEYVGST
jgi:hypothetical protein